MLSQSTNNIKKIAIIGHPGAGKSALARRLSEQLKLPLYHLDLIWHKEDKTTRYKPEFDQILSELVAQPYWIIDGNYQRTLESRVAAADMVILLDLPTDVCMEWVKSRIGTKRPDLPWVEEELDSEFEQYVLNFRKNKLPGIYEVLDKYKHEKQICVLTSRKEIDGFMM